MNSKLLYLIAGLVIGWYAHDRFAPTSYNKMAHTEQMSQRPQRANQTEINITKKSTLAVSPEYQTLDSAQNKNIGTPQKSPLDKFNTLLKKGDFDQAITLFSQVHSENELQASQLKKVLLAYLSNLINDHQTEAFTTLVDVYLSHFYDDIDVLLMWSDFNSAMGYTTESIAIYQTAFTYAYTKALRKKVENAFQIFVNTVDGDFTKQGQLFALQNFYEMLANASLANAKHEFRLAELYMRNGDLYRAKNAFEALLDSEHWAEKAAARLAKLKLDENSLVDTDYITESIAMIRRGDHYILPVKIADAGRLSLMVDTGASTTSVAKNVFESLQDTLQLEPVGQRIFNTASGVARGQVYIVPEFEFGPYILKNVELAVLDFESGSGVDGLLGMNILRNFRFQIDQDRSLLLLTQRKQ